MLKSSRLTKTLNMVSFIIIVTYIRMYSQILVMRTLQTGVHTEANRITCVIYYHHIASAVSSDVVTQ